ncbi:MAG: SAM-dependent methyltransferase [Alphaproteobacteria bacterium]|nr:SAM-dependent methyltransferase [Alphaproteobacteria bacterium]
MALALHDPRDGYYATRTSIAEDFITAPELSQMFGELIGAWSAHEWRALGAPAPFHLIELGPGTGALLRDLLRATRKDDAFRDAAQITLIEPSPALRQTQSTTLRDAESIRHAARLEDIPEGPSLIIANEVVDCFPVRQFVRDRGQWRERLVGAHPENESDLAFALSPDPLPNDAIIPAALRASPDGAVAEIAPGLDAFIDSIAARLLTHPGRALIIDYGDSDETGGDTLQAVRAHQKMDPLAAPGECDLTARVDFAALRRSAERAGLVVHGPEPQGAWLKALGLDHRTQALAQANPAKSDSLAAQHARLTAPEQMGSLFKVLCLSSPASPTPAGF